MKNLYNWLFFLPIIFMVACSPKTTAPVNQERPGKVSDEGIISALVALQESYPTHFYTKIDTKFQNSTNNHSFKTSLRIAKDSAINALITFAKIPIMTAHIDLDTVKIINRREKCFVQQDINFIQSNFGVNFDFYNIQEILMGRPIDFNPKEAHYILTDSKYYLVSTHSKKGAKDVQDDNTFIINYYLNRDLKSLAKVEMYTADKSTFVEIEFINHQEVEQYTFPKDILVTIKAPKEKTTITLSYEKVEINVPREMVATIPENYVRCQ